MNLETTQFPQCGWEYGKGYKCGQYAPYSLGREDEDKIFVCSLHGSRASTLGWPVKRVLPSYPDPVKFREHWEQNQRQKNTLISYSEIDRSLAKCCREQINSAECDDKKSRLEELALDFEMSADKLESIAAGL
jgi:hypothetical protein